MAESLRHHRSCENRIVLQLLITYTISNCHTLILKITATILIFTDSCIKQHMSKICHNCRTGKASFLIIFHIRCEYSLILLPTYHIFTYLMPPMHRSPYIAIWMILIKQMDLSLIYGKSIGIIHPADRWCHMK